MTTVAQKKKVTKKEEKPTREMRLEEAIEPLGARILVIRDTPEQRTDSGLIIPLEAQDKPNVGTVVRAGEGCITNWNTKDRVLITETAGREITVAGFTVILLDEDDVLMRFHPDSGI